MSFVELGKWTAKQREQYKLMKKGQHSFLTPYRLEKLEQIGFSWHIRTSLDPDDAGIFNDTDGTDQVKLESNEAAGMGVEPDNHVITDTMDV